MPKTPQLGVIQDVSQSDGQAALTGSFRYRGVAGSAPPQPSKPRGSLFLVAIGEAGT